MLAEKILTWQRALIGFGVAGAALMIWPSRTEAYGLPKATIVMLVAACVLLLAVCRWIVARRIEVPVGPVPLAMTLVVLVMAIATVASPTPLVALMGSSRQTGLMSYVAYLVIALVMIQAFRVDVPWVTRAFVVTAVIVGFYALLQAAGLQPLPFGIFTTPVFSTLGNSNFLSGWMAIVFPLSVLGVLSGSGGRWWRMTAAAVALMSPMVIVASRSFQGVPAALAGGTLVVGVWIGQDRRWERLWRQAVERTSIQLALAASALAVVLLAVGLLLGGPWAVDQAATGLGPRLDFWSAAARLIGDNPVIGTGPDTFGQYYPSYYERASHIGYEPTDSPHSVPLTMLAAGGIPLGLAYGGFVVITGWALVRGLRRTGGSQRLLVAGIGGAWLAYQFQSVVSIDVTPLALAHWVLAAAIVVTTGQASFRGMTLGSVPNGPRGPSRSGPRRQKAVPLAAGTRVLLVMLAALAMAAAVLVTRPMRAVAAAERAEDLVSEGAAPVALEFATTAVELAPWRAEYWFLKGRALERQGDVPAARAAARRAVELAPGNGIYAVVAAGLARRAQDHEEARQYYRHALERDPLNDRVVVEGVRALLLYGQGEEALPILEDALERRETAELWALRGRLHALQGRSDLARAAYREALRLDPSHREAQDFLGARRN